MEKRKIFFSLLIAFVLIFVSNAKIMPKEQDPIITIQVQIDGQSGKLNEDGSTTYEVLNADEIAEFYGIDNPKSIQVKKHNNKKEEIPKTQSRATCYIDNVRGPSEMCGVKVITRHTAVNETTKTITKVMSISGTVSHTFSTTVEEGVNIKAATVSAGVGFDVTESITIADSTEVVLGPGEIVTTVAMPLYDTYNFDVMKYIIFGEDKLVGFGAAYEAVGFCIITYMTN